MFKVKQHDETERTMDQQTTAEVTSYIEEYHRRLEFERAHIHLQGVGWVPAKLGSDLQVGDVLMWNFGYTGTIKDITPSKSGKTLQVVTVSSFDGKEYTRKMSASAQYGVAAS